MNVAILLWDEADPLTFVGPGQLFARAGGGGAFFVYTVAEAMRPIASGDFLTILPEYTRYQAPHPDVLVVPGGGVYYIIHRRPLLRWLRETAQMAQVILAVAGGVRVLRAAGVPGAPLPIVGELSDDEGTVEEAGAVPSPQIVEQGRVITAVSAVASVEAALRVVARLGGEGLARDAAGGVGCRR